MNTFNADNRELSDWYKDIKNGKIKLPRFQRFEAWDRRRITSLLEVIVNKLPLGITLLLEADKKPQFNFRDIKTAKSNNNDIEEFLLDGQQRLTAFWRLMNNNYENETYYIYVPDLDKADFLDEEGLCGFCQTRWNRNINSELKKYPIWSDNPKECLQRGLIPSNLLNPDSNDDIFLNWLDLSLEIPKIDSDTADINTLKEHFKKNSEKENIAKKIRGLRTNVSSYNLPYLRLDSTTPKDVALNVFINMNTNSKPLSIFDIVVAEIENVKGESLHQMINILDKQYPKIKNYFDLDYLVLYSSCLIQDKIPNQRGIIEIDKEKLVENWGKLVKGLNKMTDFLYNEGIYDRQRLPTNAVLAVISAILSDDTYGQDKKGQISFLLKKYLWKAFFTDRYENSSASRAFADYKGIKKVIDSNTNEKIVNDLLGAEIPIFNDTEFPIVDEVELMQIKWPKGENIKGRGIIAITTLLGAFDFASGEKITSNNLSKMNYHHIFPDSIIKDIVKNSSLALNCALISESTNKSIGNKDPLEYLKDRYKWNSEDIVNNRLKSHLIPIDVLKNATYKNLDEEEKIKRILIDFESFIRKRAKLIKIAINHLCNGEQINSDNIFKKAEQKSM